jgi:hypothetical protein
VLRPDADIEGEPDLPLNNDRLVQEDVRLPVGGAGVEV